MALNPGSAKPVPHRPSQLLESVDLDLACQLFQEACEVYEEEGAPSRAIMGTPRKGPPFSPSHLNSRDRVILVVFTSFRKIRSNPVRYPCGGAEKYHVAVDVYRQAAIAAIRQDKVDDAAALLLKNAQACEKANAVVSQCRCYLAAVVTYLHGKDPVQAEACYNDCLGIEAFEKSEESRIIYELLDVRPLRRGLTQPPLNPRE